MLPRIVLFFLQLFFAYWLGEITQPISRALTLQPQNQIFVYALIYAALVMLVGYSGSRILKDVSSPSGLTLIVCFALAILLALLTIFPQITQPLHTAVPFLRNNLYIYPLLGAMVGYYVAR